MKNFLTKLGLCIGLMLAVVLSAAATSQSLKTEKGIKLSKRFMPRPTLMSQAMMKPDVQTVLAPWNMSAKKSEVNNLMRRQTKKANGTDVTTLYGTIIYSEEWTSANKYGVYSFPATSGTTFTAQFLDNTYCKADANAVYHHGIYSMQNAKMDDSKNITGVNYYEFTTEDWSESNENELSAFYYAADFAVDPLTGKIYGALANSDGGMDLCIVDFNSFTRTVVGKLSQLMSAIAINAEGTLYGIGQNGKLYQVSTADASLKEIGNTGITPSYLQSATIDLATGKFYWATTTTANKAGLYVVDTTTGKATLVSDFAHGEEVVGLYSLSKLSADAAPAAVTNLSATFDGIATTGKVSFTMPLNTNSGEALTGALTYSITINGTEVKTGTAMSGAEVTETLTVPTGDAKIVVTVSNDAGKGTPAVTEKWIGYDDPAAPANLNVALNDKTVSLSWDAPVTGAHSGTIDVANLKYDVTRYPDKVTVAKGITATNYTDVISSTALTAYYYVVTAYTSDTNGASATSKTVSIGDAVALPYKQPFDDESTFGLLSTIDGDGDGSTWSFSASSSAALLDGAPFESTDDWVVLPKFKFTADRLYKVSYRTQCSWAGNYPYNTAVCIGTAADEESLSSKIVSAKDINKNEVQNFEGYFKVAADGNYYIGMQVNGYDIQNIKLDSIIVEEGPAFAAPDSVKSLQVKADADGADKATVSFVTPSTTIDGKTLNALSKIEVYRNGTLITTLNAPAVGASLTVTDAQPADGAINHYRVVAYNASGVGMPVSSSAYVGVDLPVAPQNVMLQVVNSTKANVSWQAPATGVNGGYIQPDVLAYGIIRNDTVVRGNGVQTTSITDNIIQTGAQKWCYYMIYARNSKGYGNAGISNPTVAGANYQLPFHDSFVGGVRKYFWGADQYNSQDWGADWGMQTGEDGNGDGGSFVFGTSGREGSGAHLFSGKVSLAGAKNPVVEFYYTHRAEDNEAGKRHNLQIGVIKNGKDTVILKEFEPIYFYQIDLKKPWHFARISLKDVADADYIQFVANAVKDGTNFTGIDDVNIRDFADNDLEAGIQSPKSAAAGDTIHIIGTVKNVGAKTAENYTVQLMSGNKVIAEQIGTSVATDSVLQYTFGVKVGTLSDSTNYSIHVQYDADEVESNNTSATKTVAVTLPTYPAPKDLTTTEPSKASLTWTQPDYQNYALPAVEDVEGMTAFAIDNLSSWTTVDGDKKATRNDIKIDGTDINYTHKGDAFAWIVMNPVAASIPTESWTGEGNGWQPVSGKQYLASITSADGANNDWLISPELAGDEQTISFSQHGYYGMEKYEVLYSTTTADTTAFTSLGIQSSASDWTQVSFPLPAGTKYFAIRNLGGESSQSIFVDDIHYIPLSNKGILNLLGYRVYRDGEEIAQLDANTTSYTDDKATDATHTYQITALYNLGESSSATIEVTIATGVNATNANAILPTIYYSIDGKRLSTPSVGINIIRMGNSAPKKIIRR